MWRRVLLFVVAVVVGVLGYGYWFGATHGSLTVSVTEVADRLHPRDVTPVALTFLDEDSRPLAQAATVAPYNAIVITGPPPYGCHQFETGTPYSAEVREQWVECFSRQSRWLPTWIGKARRVEVRSGTCTVGTLPIDLTTYPDTWWLWWVPLPHIGGKPYTTFSVHVELGRPVAC